MFNDELHFLSINPWSDDFLSRPLYRGDVAVRGSVVPTIAELSILPARKAADEAAFWLYGKPAPHICKGIREALAFHPEASDPTLLKVLKKFS
ncbi:hypothetical protein [Halomonas sp. AOP43-D1-12]|uniref:hypothetical protein n=1 Tax=Halomonas sp. AOP43-D1-12 TaxID=3457660 RepID=UPI004033E97B